MTQIEELRRIIVGENAEQLAELKARIENIDQRTLDVSEVLTPAIKGGLKKDGQALISVLKEPVSLGLKQAIRAEPDEYADILYPAMAPSIRRIISQAISSLLITINNTIESATSAQGIKTRIQSLRTGVPYAELSLRQSILYRVEHVYLIHRDSGMKVGEVTSGQSTSLDSDAVSAMFSAIQSFVQDSFSQDKTAMLTDLKVGEYTVWVAHGPSLMLACVINGDAPEALKDDLYDALYEIRTSYANQIAGFNGDADEFLGAEDLMHPLLQLELKQGSDKKKGIAKHSRFLLFLMCCLMLAALGYTFLEQRSKVTTVEHFLRQTPGVVITDIFFRDRAVVVEGFQDPDAKIPFSVFETYGISQQSLNLQTVPFRSLAVDMELQRFQDEFVVPKGVTLNPKNNKIQLHGLAPLTWLNDHGSRIQQLAIDRRLNISELTASPVSVIELLTDTLDPTQLSMLEIVVADGGLGKVTRIVGSLSADKAAELDALFANNVWIETEVTIVSTANANLY